MRIHLAIGFLILYGIAMLRPIAPILEYQLNRDYIANVLCINKDQPITVCEGSCYLAKRLKQQQQKEQSAPQVQLKDYPIGWITLLRVQFSPLISEATIHGFHYDHYSFLGAISLFHPPQG
ncbi:MAG: hypothetical protein RIG62_08625 [Cyclobacteriaceae bacterium]